MLMRVLLHTLTTATAAILLVALGGPHCVAQDVVIESGAGSVSERDFARLLSYRFRAIETAFGSLAGAMDQQILLSFNKDSKTARSVYYDANTRRLSVPRVLLYSAPRLSSRIAEVYWPFYEDVELQQAFPLIETIDTVLWDAYLQEAARGGGHAWPPANCASFEVSKRLPCRMIVRGALEFVRQLHLPLFNDNRIDRVWPENLSEFARRTSRMSREYDDAERYGGILLLRTLVGEFGVPRTLAYAARTPFEVADNDVRASALRYQERARTVLAESHGAKSVNDVNPAPQ
jgi:hypothetical protein